MRAELDWLDDALATRDVVLAMTHYRVRDKFMTATNGRLTAGYPCNIDEEFLVPGDELKNILKRLPDEPKVSLKDDVVTLRAGRFFGTLKTLQLSEWRFPEHVEVFKWKPFPQTLLPILRDLRPFIADNAIHRWSCGVAIDHGWCYASDNVVLAGAAFPEGADMQSLIPSWVIDFLLERSNGLVDWATTNEAMGFRWRNGAWMRSSLIDDRFPPRAGEMIRQASVGSQKIDKEYRQAITRVAELSQEAVSIYADRVQGQTTRTMVQESLKSEVPPGSDCSLWSPKSLALTIGVASNWSPSVWPKPAPFHGERIRGFIAGRTG